MRKYSGGSHEILFSYLFGKKENKIPEVIVVNNLPTDSDGDGILDNQDKCPQMTGPSENFGCPWADSDDNGILDNKDNCPSEFGPIENKGCPYLDLDLDGIIDIIDECPKTPGDKSNNGCPIIDEQDRNTVDIAVKNLEFQIFKDIIEENSKPSLDMVAMRFKERQYWKFLISGHTDNFGDENENLMLSKRRSEAVKKYLISKGINEERIQIEYFGESRPIADNSTPEGRKKNRRVEIKIIFD